MNIKELVPVISILLSIRIAEYAMKKYKEQKDVEVTKKQKSRKQTKKYIITAPSILKVGLPCGIFFGCTTIAFIFKSDLQMGICTTDRKLLFYVDLFVGIYRIYSIRNCSDIIWIHMEDRIWHTRDYLPFCIRNYKEI